MRGLLTEWLTGVGYAVRERGLRAAPAGEGADLVIVDLYMPRQAGADIVLAAQQAYPGAPVIAMSAQFRPGLDCSAGAAHALGVRSKVGADRSALGAGLKFEAGRGPQRFPVLPVR